MTLLLTIPLVMLGGSLGAICRYLLQALFASRTNLPGWCGIMIINIIGSFLIGLAVKWISAEIGALKPGGQSLMGLELERLELQELMALTAVGFCGAFTTFSTFSLDNVFLATEGRGRLLVNTLGSVVFCLGAVWGGWALGSAVSA